jgi:hypothetical protein
MKNTIELKPGSDGVYHMDADAIRAALTEKPATAELEASGIGGIFQKAIDFKPMGVPVGAGVVGGVTAYGLSALSDYIIAKTAKTNADGTRTPVVPMWAADLGMAFAAVLIGKKVKAAAPALNIAAMFLVYEAARQPLETAIDKILHPTTATAQPMMQSVMAQANAVADQAGMRAPDYYSRAER